MKLKDIIDFDLSYWNVLGQHGGTALPDNDKSVNVDGIEIWKKHPPFRTGKKKQRIEEAQAGVGAGLGGTGATQHPVSGPSEPEHDLGRKHLKKEFKGKDSRADIKTNKDKRETLKQYLDRRSTNA